MSPINGSLRRQGAIVALSAAALFAAAASIAPAANALSLSTGDTTISTEAISVDAGDAVALINGVVDPTAISAVSTAGGLADSAVTTAAGLADTSMNLVNQTVSDTSVSLDGPAVSANLGPITATASLSS